VKLYVVHGHPLPYAHDFCPLKGLQISMSDFDDWKEEKKKKLLILFCFVLSVLFAACGEVGVKERSSSNVVVGGNSVMIGAGPV
jgi:hypothetical protein